MILKVLVFVAVVLPLLDALPYGQPIKSEEQKKEEATKSSYKIHFEEDSEEQVKPWEKHHHEHKDHKGHHECNKHEEEKSLPTNKPVKKVPHKKPNYLAHKRETRAASHDGGWGGISWYSPSTPEWNSEEDQEVKSSYQSGWKEKPSYNRPVSHWEPEAPIESHNWESITSEEFYYEKKPYHNHTPKYPPTHPPTYHPKTKYPPTKHLTKPPTTTTTYKPPPTTTHKPPKKEHKDKLELHEKIDHLVDLLEKHHKKPIHY